DSNRRQCKWLGDRPSSSELDHLALDILSKGLEGFGDDAFGVETRLGIHSVRRVLVDKDIRQHHRANLETAIEHAMLSQCLHYKAAEAANRALLDRQQHFMFACQTKQQVNIKWL